MTILTLQLVFDCSDPDEIMRFWGRALGYENDLVHMQPDELTTWRREFPQYDGRGRIDDAAAHRMPVYIQKVPEPKGGRNRLRPEIATPKVEATRADLEMMGAGVQGAELTDVEGNEFTVVQDDGDLRLRSIVFDCLDLDRMLEFWSNATGYNTSGNRCDPPSGSRTVDGGKWVVDGDRMPLLGLNPKVTDGVVFDLVPGLAFEKTDEPKRTKNRLHIDLWTNDAEGHRDRLLELGATMQQWDTDHVMLDPEGNEFCVT